MVTYVFLFRCSESLFRHAVRLATFHYAHSRAEHILLGMFITFLTKGYCCPDEAEGDASAEGQSSFRDDVAGTGMGDAEGKKDVSEQIEDEEQLMGTTQEEKEEKPNLPKDDNEKEKGFDMDQDFDGTMESMPDTTVLSSLCWNLPLIQCVTSSQDTNEEDENSEDEENLDKEMGDLESEEENVVDEKLWDEDEEDHKEQEGKTEKDTPIDVDGDTELELAAKVN